MEWLGKVPVFGRQPNFVDISFSSPVALVVGQSIMQNQGVFLLELEDSNTRFYKHRPLPMYSMSNHLPALKEKERRLKKVTFFFQ